MRLVTGKTWPKGGGGLTGPWPGRPERRPHDLCLLLTLHFEPRLALVQMNRPVARNALSQALMRELIALARELAERTLAMPVAAVCMSKQTVNAVATARHHLVCHMGHDQIALASASADSWAARAAALPSRDRAP